MMKLKIKIDIYRKKLSMCTNGGQNIYREEEEDLRRD